MGSLLVQTPIEHNVKFWDFLKADYDQLMQALLFVPWEELMASVTDVEQAWSIFLSVLNPLLDRYVPVRTHSWSVSGRPHVIRLCKLAYLCHRRYKLTGLHSDYLKYLEASRLAQ
ncbi:MAG: hypothetical protein GY858_08190 [Candidatus Omnitrophica bacterium]|nr:hypothetical protein [Candidatus Omnitrophota bacterium]